MRNSLEKIPFLAAMLATKASHFANVQRCLLCPINIPIYLYFYTRAVQDISKIYIHIHTYIYVYVYICL